MKYKQFKQEAQRTVKECGNIRENLYHMVVGLTSEQSELEGALESGDKINIMEELVDKLWYVANYETFRGISVLDEYVPNPGAEQPNIYITTLESKLADMVKKFNVYGKNINEKDEKALLEAYMNTIYKIAGLLEIDIEEGYDRIINKLKVRYPEKFTETNAIERDLEEERKVLEGEGK